MDSAWAIVILTTVLVGVTAYYAWQNRRIVLEMRRSRELTVAPKLVVSIFMAGPTYGITRVVNTGQGPALQVDVTIAFHRRDGSGAVERRWQSNFMPPGVAHDFFEPDDFGQIGSVEALADICSEVTIKGTMRSSLGQIIQVHETTGDLREWFSMAKDALQQWKEEPQRKIPAELEAIRKELVKINRSLSQSSR